MLQKVQEKVHKTFQSRQKSKFLRKRLKRTLYILDHLKEQASRITISMARGIVNCILQKKFEAINECTVGKMKYLQQDAVSCGVLTCCYAYKIAQREFIPCFFSNLKKRQKTKKDNIYIKHFP